MLPQSLRPRAADDYATIRGRMEELRGTRPRVADDFTAIRARMEELRREREQNAARQQEPPARGPRLYYVREGGKLPDPHLLPQPIVRRLLGFG